MAYTYSLPLHPRPMTGPATWLPPALTFHVNLVGPFSSAPGTPYRARLTGHALPGTPYRVDLTRCSFRGTRRFRRALRRSGGADCTWLRDRSYSRSRS